MAICNLEHDGMLGRVIIIIIIILNLEFQNIIQMLCKMIFILAVCFVLL